MMDDLFKQAERKANLVISPGWFDALLFWSVYAGTTTVIVWLLVGVIKVQFREQVAMHLNGITMLASSAVGMQEAADGPVPQSEILTRLSQKLPQVRAIRVFEMRRGEFFEISSGGMGSALDLSDESLVALLDAAMISTVPVFPKESFLYGPQFDVFGRIVRKPDLGACRVEGASLPQIVVLDFDGTAIEEVFRRIDEKVLQILVFCVILATLLGMFVNIRSRQRQEAIEERLAVVSLLGRCDAVMSAVASTADDLLAGGKVEPLVKGMLQEVVSTLSLRTAYLALLPVGALRQSEEMVIALDDGTTPLRLEELQSTEMAPVWAALQRGEVVTGEEKFVCDVWKSLLQQKSVASMAVAPVLTDGRLTGVICFVAASRRMQWDAGLLDTFKLAADLVGAAYVRNEQEDRLVDASKMQALGRMAGGVAHEFNNLLHIIGGNLRQLRTKRDGSDDERQALIGRIEDASLRGKRIVEQLLNATRQGESRLHPCSLNGLLERTVELARPAIGRDVKIELELRTNLPPCLMDEAQIQQVVLNILLNAGDAMGGDGSISVRSFFSEAEGNGLSVVTAEISDTGPGIDENHLDHIFDPFFTTKEPGKGTGLGLSTSRGIMEQHRGGLSVSNIKPHGAAFTLTLPVADAVEVPRVDAIQSNEPGVDTAGGGVLIVDDEPSCREVLQAILEEQGFDVIAGAGNGHEALALAQDHVNRIHWVVTDWSLPGPHGRNLTCGLRKCLPDAKIIVASGYILQPGEIPEIDGVILKPFTANELRDVMAAVEQKFTASRQ